MADVHTIPQGNAGGQGIITDVGYTQFQHREMMRRVKKSDFNFVCASHDGLRADGGTRHPGPICFLYYTTDGKLHVARIGMRRILQEASA